MKSISIDFDYRCTSCGNCVEVPGAGTQVGGRDLQPYCYYCVAPALPHGARKLGHKVDWMGHAPSWCPSSVTRKEDAT